MMCANYTGVPVCSGGGLCKRKTEMVHVHFSFSLTPCSVLISHVAFPLPQGIKQGESLLQLTSQNW